MLSVTTCATGRLRSSALAVVLLAGLTTELGCGSGRPPRDAGPRSDVGPRLDGGGGGDMDAGGGAGDLDAWLDPTVDARIDAVDPSTVDAWRPDANQDVGPVDAFGPPTPDSGGGGSGVDGGIVVRRDAGRYDGGLDARVPTGACGILWERGDPVPEECLPRCSATSGDLFRACLGDTTCEATVMAGDTTRAVRVFVWEEWDFSDLDCASCIGTQRFSCWHDRCPAQAEDWVDCLAGRSSEACEREQLLLERCLAPFEASVLACTTARVDACFPR